MNENLTEKIELSKEDWDFILDVLFNWEYSWGSVNNSNLARKIRKEIKSQRSLIK